MITGRSFILFGILVLVYPQMLAILFAAFLIRRRKHSDPRFINWIVRW